MTIVMVKDGVAVADSATCQYTGQFKSFNTKKTRITENGKWWTAGSGALSTTQRFQEEIEDDEFNLNSFDFKDDDTTEMVCINLEDTSVNYMVSKIGVTKTPSDVPLASGTAELYWLALLDAGMSVVEAFEFVADKNRINFVGFPLWVFSVVEKQEYIIDEDRIMQPYE